MLDEFQEMRLDALTRLQKYRVYVLMDKKGLSFDEAMKKHKEPLEEEKGNGGGE